MHDYYAPDFEVKIEGLTMEADVTHAIIDLTYESSLDTADMVTMRLNNADLRFTDSALFDVGKNIELYMGYVGNLQPMMLGEIAAVSPEFPESGAPTLTVTGYDKSYRMRQNHKLRTFPLSNPSLIALQIAAENLLIPQVEPSPWPPEDITQNSSDMEFLQELADRTFYDVYVNWDRLCFQVPRPQMEAVCLEWGKNLSSFSPRLSTADQVGAISVLDYDSELAQAIVGLVPVVAAEFDLDALVERLGSTILDQLTNFGIKKLTGQHVASFPGALTLAKAVLASLLDGLFEGHGSCIGIPELQAGKMVEISGVGRRFSGKYRLRSVTHTIGEGGYRTSFEVTQRNSGTFLQLTRRFLGVEREQRMTGALTAKVLNNVDPKRLGRVQVLYPSLGGEVINWARVAPIDKKSYFMPDIGDDVVVTFEYGNIDRPVITGGSWNVIQTPPEIPTPLNPKRIIGTRAGHTITLDDTAGIGGITLETALGAKVTLTDGPSAGNITIETINSPENGAKIILDDTPGAENIILESADKGAKIAIDGAGNITIETAGTVSINAGTINMNSGVQGAARQGDDVDVTIPAGTFITEVTGNAVGKLNEKPVPVKGFISKASQTVKIGG